MAFCVFIRAVYYYRCWLFYFCYRVNVSLFIWLTKIDYIIRTHKNEINNSCLELKGVVISAPGDKALELAGIAIGDVLDEQTPFARSPISHYVVLFEAVVLETTVS